MLDDLVWNLLDVALDFRVCELSSDETFRGEQCILGVDDGLTLSCNSNKSLAFLRKSYYGGCRTCAYTVLAQEVEHICGDERQRLSKWVTNLLHFQ